MVLKRKNSEPDDYFSEMNEPNTLELNIFNLNAHVARTTLLVHVLRSFVDPMKCQPVTYYSYSHIHV